jgi:hypothetical protein
MLDTLLVAGMALTIKANRIKKLPGRTARQLTFS